jgi:hypothetical protein
MSHPTCTALDTSLGRPRQTHPQPPQYTLVWITVAALVLVLVFAAWRGWS